jgi:hypothetical protein
MLTDPDSPPIVIVPQYSTSSGLMLSIVPLLSPRRLLLRSDRPL